jgi:hypothetical protein
MSVENPDQPWWHREPAANKTEFLSESVSVEHFWAHQNDVLAELKSILRRELSVVREFHLVRLRVDIELCH